MATDSHTFGPRWRVVAGMGAALWLMALAVWLDANRLPPHVTAGVGPAAAMHLVAVLLAALGLAHLVTAWGHRVREREEGFTPRDAHPATNTGALAWILGGLTVLAVCVHMGGGFVLGATALFAGTARAFGQPLNVRSVGLGLGLTTGVFLFFARVLSLGLPAGPLERLLLA